MDLVLLGLDYLKEIPISHIRDILRTKPIKIRIFYNNLIINYYFQNDPPSIVKLKFNNLHNQLSDRFLFLIKEFFSKNNPNQILEFDYNNYSYCSLNYMLMLFKNISKKKFMNCRVTNKDKKMLRFILSMNLNKFEYSGIIFKNNKIRLTFHPKDYDFSQINREAIIKYLILKSNGLENLRQKIFINTISNL